MRERIFAGIILSLTAPASNAALLGRLPATPGGTNYQAYYDNALNITWLADANYAATNTFGITRSGIAAPPPGQIGATGAMSWDTAQNWIAAMNAANYIGVSDWRLPQILDTGTPGCDFGFSGTDCGYNVQTIDGSTVYNELAHLYYVTLGNPGFFDTSGNSHACGGPPSYCRTNDGPFSNIQINYWQGGEYGHDPCMAWYFAFYEGSQEAICKVETIGGWAVRPGDIAPVPLPAVGWLLAPAFGLLGVARRRAAD